PILHLDRSPLVVRAVPACWNEAGGPCDRPWIPGPVRQIGRKDLAFVRGYDNIVGGRALRKNRQLALNLDDAAVRPTRAAGILEHLLLDNSRSEPLGRASQPIAVELVLGMGTDDQQPSAPLLPDQVLRQSVGQHRPCWSSMNHIGAAVLLPQSIVDRADI